MLATYRIASAARGVTLLELIVTLTVVALLAAFGIPALYDYVQNLRLTAEINRLVAHLHLARTVAISRNTNVVMCKSDDQRACADPAPRGADWSRGWILFVDDNDNGVHDSAELVLHRQEALNEGLTVRFNQPGRVRYQPTGIARSGRFTICDLRGAQFARSVILYWTGRPRTIRETGGPFAQVCAGSGPAT